MSVHARAATSVSLVLAVMLWLGACGGDGGDGSGGDGGSMGAPPSTSPTPDTAGAAVGAVPTTFAGRTIELVVRGGSVEGGVRRQRVSLNDRVRLVVTSDVAEELHVHGYDRRAPLQPGVPAEVVFTADIAGVFEVELENSHRRLIMLEVAP